MYKYSNIKTGVLGIGCQRRLAGIHTYHVAFRKLLQKSVVFLNYSYHACFGDFFLFLICRNRVTKCCINRRAVTVGFCDLGAYTNVRCTAQPKSYSRWYLKIQWLQFELYIIHVKKIFCRINQAEGNFEISDSQVFLV